MIIRTLIAVAALLSSFVRPARAQCMFLERVHPRVPVLLYRFALRGAADTTVLDVTLEFSGNRTGVDTIAIPSQWAGVRLHSIRNLRAHGRGVEIDSIPGRSARLVRHAPDAAIKISYELTKDWTGPLNHPDEFQPVILPDYIEFTGSNALVQPQFALYTPVVVHFDWSRLPPSWTIATSFGTADAVSEEATERSGGRCQTHAGTWYDVGGALYAAGDFRLHRFAINQSPAVLAIRGTWLFSDSAVVAEVQRDVGLVRAFWHDDDFPYFLVTWAPFDRAHRSGDGSAFTNALWIYMSRLDSLSTQITQLTHESFHEWDPRRMGRVLFGEEQRIGWFREGFTAYYADVIAYRAGLISLGDVVRRVNRDLQNFSGSTDAYTRGDVIARWLDGAIRDHTNGKRSLDDVMHAMVREANRPLTLDRVLSTADRYLSSSDQATLRELATGTGAPPAALSAGALAPCVRVTLDSVYAFDPGFDVAASVAARRVTGVRAGGAAYSAGLRDDQPLLGWSFYNGHSERPVAFTVQIDSVRDRISYYPRGAGALAPQFHIPDGYVPQSGICGR